MTPMRNVPFRVIAMLGLNNGKFPRQESAISFDLMARLGRVKGDRTKRDDDRYLFLETITSARDYLYLSYIGRSVKTNVEQQPSLILKELISYLQKNYSWHTLDNVIKDNKLPKSERKNIISDIKEYPLHPFSSKCYADEYRSYDEAWLKLLQSEPKVFYDSKLLSNSVNLPKSLSISKLVKIFEDPIKAYTNYGLELYLEDDFEELEDSEPFDINSLDKHKFKQDLLNTLENNKDKELTIKTAKLSGKLPESVLTENEINKEVESIQKLLDKANLANYESKYFHQEILGYELEANCHIKDNQVLLYTSSTFGIKHRFELYLTALLVALSEQQDISATYVYFDKDKNQADTNTFAISHLGAKQLLEKYLSNAEKIVSKPSLVHLDLAKAIMEYVKENQKKDASLVEKTTKQKQQAWENVIKSSETNYKALENNSYFKLFYSEHPKIEDFEGQQIYQDFFEVINENK